MPLGPHHDRAAFSCGDSELDSYVYEQLGQDIRRSVTVGHVLCEPENPKIIGFYTLNATSVVLKSLPAEVRRRLPRYPDVPAILLGRLAVSQDFQGQELGRELLVNAMERTLSIASQAGVAGLVVDAENDAVVPFYEHFEFVRLQPTALRLFLPIDRIRSAYEQ